MCTFLLWIVHCGIWNRCIMGSARLTSLYLPHPIRDKSLIIHYQYTPVTTTQRWVIKYHLHSITTTYATDPYEPPIWVRTWWGDCLLTWFCHHFIATSGNKLTTQQHLHDPTERTLFTFSFLTLCPMIYKKSFSFLTYISQITRNKVKYITHKVINCYKFASRLPLINFIEHQYSLHIWHLKIGINRWKLWVSKLQMS